MAAISSTNAFCSEAMFLERIADDPEFQPLIREGVKEKLQVPVRPKDEDPDSKAAYAKRQNQYQDAVNEEFVKFSNDDETSDVYLCFQPMWNALTRTLTGLEVLARVMDGSDNAPMPGMKVWQETDRVNSTKFLHKQISFATAACQKMPEGLTVSVNCRPDELAAAKDHIKECAATTGNGCASLLMEVTEYSAITDEVLDLVEEMKADGCLFALDDVSEVNDNPGKAMEKTGQHACSFALAKRRKDLFAVQKLATKLSCSVFRVLVFPTPQYAGGTPNNFLKSMIFPEDQREEIDLRKRLVEDWVKEIREHDPEVRIVIECSISPDDLANKPKDLFPQINIFDGSFEVQGGLAGGRGYPLEAFMPEQIMSC